MKPVPPGLFAVTGWGRAWGGGWGGDRRGEGWSGRARVILWRSSANDVPVMDVHTAALVAPGGCPGAALLEWNPSQLIGRRRGGGGGGEPRPLHPPHFRL